MQQILSGEKLALRMDEIQQVPLVTYPELGILNLYELLKDD